MQENTTLWQSDHFLANLGCRVMTERIQLTLTKMAHGGPAMAPWCSFLLALFVSGALAPAAPDTATTPAMPKAIQIGPPSSAPTTGSP